MRHIPLCLIVPFVLACGLVGPDDTTIQVQGQVTAAEDGSPIAGASVELRYREATSIASWTSRHLALSITDAQGHYSLSYVKEGGCGDLFSLVVKAQGFTSEGISSLFDDPHITCTEEVQAFDVQLEREST